VVWAACAVLKEDDPAHFAFRIIKRRMEHIRIATRAHIMINVIGELGRGTYRDKVYPEYKANRTQPRPKHYEEAREYFMEHFDAHIARGIEADDYVGIVGQAMRDKCNVTMVHIDKDLDMLPGCHYNFRKKEFYHVTPLDGYKHYGIQMLKGDSTDNIPGLFKLTGRRASAKYKQRILDAESREDVNRELLEIYTEGLELGSEEYDNMIFAMDINHTLLWILQEPLNGPAY
jgi:hypothetical protein